MSRRKKIILLVLAILLGIFAIVILLLSLGQRAPLFNRTVNEPPVVGGNISTSGNLNAAVDTDVPPTLTEIPATQSTLLAIATSFAERFGSFSSESNFENLSDLKVLMTNKMKSWTENFIAQNQGQPVEFYGITTRALNAEIITLAADETQAQILVTTQREETKSGAARSGVYYQKILLNLVQEGGSWKVDGATWQ